MCSERNYKDIGQLQAVIDEFIVKNEVLEEDVGAKATINELLEDEHTTDVETLLQWAADLDSHEEDILSLLKYQDADRIRIKEIHLKLEKMRSSAAKDKANLDEASTDNKMSLLALEKTAVEFRTSHDDRQKNLDKWKEAVELIERRDVELEEMFGNMTTIKERVVEAQSDLKEQSMFLTNERGNNGELHRAIEEEERRAQSLMEELEQKEKELEAMDGEVILQRRETWRIGGEIDGIRSKWQNAKKEYKRKLGQIEAISKEVNDLKEKKKVGGHNSLNSEEKAGEMARLLEAEQRAHDAIQWELDRTREKKLVAENNLADLKASESTNNIALKGIKIEKSNLSKSAKAKTEILLKNEEILLASNYTLSKVEKELARIKGEEVNRAKLKADLDSLKTVLDSRLADKRNLDHLVHKMLADVKKVTHDLKVIGDQEAKVKAELEKIHMENESCNKEKKAIGERVESLLLEEKMMKVSERKVRSGLESLNRDLADLQKQNLEVNEKLSEERADLESRRDLYASQARCLKGEVATIKGEIRERKDRAEKLKIKYDLIVKSLGDAEQTDNPDQLPSHAFQLVKLAQEKSELRDHREAVAKKVEKEEKELLGLENALELLRKSNKDFRADHLYKKGEDEENDEVYFLKQKIKIKIQATNKIKKALDACDIETKTVQEAISRLDAQIEDLKRALEEKTIEIRSIDKDLEEMERKHARAQAVRATLMKELRVAAQNADFFEQDMDLRTEKQKQQSALIKLKEICDVDPSGFSSRCQADLTKAGFILPNPSRLSTARTRSVAIKPSPQSQSRKSSVLYRGQGVNPAPGSTGGTPVTVGMGHSLPPKQTVQSIA